MLPYKTLTILIFIITQVLNHEPPQDTAEETQHAICKVITQEIQTSANATIKRQLKGVCTSSQIDRKFKQLERKLIQELNNIKNLLNRKTVKAQDYDYFNYEEKSLDQNIVSVTEMTTQDFSWFRREIELNNTISMLKGEQVFTYYWKVPNIQLILQNGIYSKSDNFQVLDYQCYLELYPKYLHSDYLGLKLGFYFGISRKHKFTILDQIDSSKDLNSQAFGLASNHDEIYKIPYAKIQERNYLYNDSLILKVMIYLNS